MVIVSRGTRRFRGRKRKPRPVSLAVVHDRRTGDVPINGMVDEAEIDDPLEPGGRLMVIRSLRDDPLARLHARDQLRSPSERKRDAQTGRDTGVARFHAGRRWQAYFEQSIIGGVRGIDTTREPVDGGKLPEVLTDTQRRAVHHLIESYQALGRDGYEIVCDVLRDGRNMAEICRSRGMFNAEYFGHRFRECLERLAKLWGFVK